MTLAARKADAAAPAIAQSSALPAVDLPEVRKTYGRGAGAVEALRGITSDIGGNDQNEAFSMSDRIAVLS